MESPPADESRFELDAPPSSPFVSEANSRLSSKTWHADAPSKTIVSPDNTLEFFATPMKQHRDGDPLDNKENVAQCESITARAAPEKPRTPPHRNTLQRETDSLSGTPKSLDQMPPPPASIRKAHTITRQTPLQESRSAANIRSPPRPTSSCNNSPEPTELTRTAARTSPANVETRSSHFAAHQTEEGSTIDDTCFSAFSAVPNLTTWSKIGQTPNKRGDSLRTSAKKTTEASPRNAVTTSTARKRPSPSRSPSPTPRRHKTPGHGHSISHDGTTFLIDFTQQMDGMAGYCRQASPSKSHTQPDLLHYMNSQRSPQKSVRQGYATPAKQSNIMNLLDFDLPPAPTPRSVPTITVRELESLKSSYLSQISSLKATLSGREAEVESLKRAVNDAERRVGEAQETVRDEKNRREYAEQEKSGWEKRGQEVEHLLQTVKEEVLKGEAEKEELARKFDESVRRAEDAETRAVRAEERFADAVAARAACGEGGEVEATAIEQRVHRLVAAQIDSKIEAVSRELHSVYKEKHERKVATLKKSYEARSEKKCAELQSRLSELEKSNEDLMAAKDAFSGQVPVADTTALIEAEADLKAQIEEQRAQFARLDAELHASSEQMSQLERELAQERIEKGDLVAAVDEMLALQLEAGGPTQGALSVVEDFRKSISRPPSAISSGLRAPGSSGIGAAGGSKIGGLGRTGNGAGRGGMMSRIEKMGSGRAASAGHE